MKNTCEFGYNSCTDCCDIDGDCLCDDTCTDSEKTTEGCSYQTCFHTKTCYLEAEECAVGYNSCEGKCCDIDSDCLCDELCV